MKRILYSMLILFCFSMVAITAADYIDVVEMKNGNIYKGVIVENVIDEYVMIELTGGSSVFKLVYRDIRSFKKEQSGSNQAQIVINNANTNVNEAVNTGSSQLSQNVSSLPITFTARKGLFKPAYYTFMDNNYQEGFGYGDLLEAIAMTPDLPSSISEEIGKQQQYYTRAERGYWLGLAVELAGGAWMIAEEIKVLSGAYDHLGGDEFELLIDKCGPGLLTMTGGMIFGLINARKLQEKPVEVVMGYNSLFK